MMLGRSLQSLTGDQKPVKQNASLINRLSTRRKDRSRQYGSFTRPSSVTSASSSGTHSAVAVEMMKSRFESQHLHKTPTDLNQTGKNGQWSVVITTNFTLYFFVRIVTTGSRSVRQKITCTIGNNDRTLSRSCDTKVRRQFGASYTNCRYNDYNQGARRGVCHKTITIMDQTRLLSIR